ncbi:EAL domain-containing protein [Aquifex aeolicus]
MENLLTEAVKENLFVFHYQPIFEAKTGNLAGFEALVRIKKERYITRMSL